MKKAESTKKRILTAGAGMVAITAVEGLACGNPVAPRHDMPHEMDPDTTAVPVDSASAAASSDAATIPSSSASVPDADADAPNVDGEQ